MTIRQATLADTARLAGLHAAVFPASPWEEPFWADAIGDDGTTVLIGKVDEADASLLALRQVLDEAEVLTIGVMTEYRGRGLGAALLADGLSRLSKAGADRVFLEVETTNEAAVSLYRRAGFSVVGDRRNYYGPGRDAALMEHILTSACSGL